MCKCRRGLVPDREEPHPLVQCQEDDPCDPNPCGVLYPDTTTCTPNNEGSPVCRCLPGLIPKPDTITGCGPECLVDPDCLGGYICSQQKCIERPDPCVPNPCGSGAFPINEGSQCSCECPLGYVGDGYTGCNRGECLVNEDCPLDKACSNFYCVDPCSSGTCKSSDFCRVMIHRAICGFNEKPKSSPRDETFVIGERYTPTVDLPSRTPVTVGERNPPEQRMMMMMMDTSNLPVIGIASRRKRQHAVRRRRLRKLDSQ